MTTSLNSPEAWDSVEWGHKDGFAPTLAAYARAAVALAPDLLVRPDPAPTGRARAP